MAKRKKKIYWPISEPATFIPKVLSGDILPSHDEQVTEQAAEVLRDVVAMESTMAAPPEVQAELRGLARGLTVGDKLRKAIPDDSSWVAASKLCPDKGVSLNKARAFCEKHKIRFRKPSSQRLEIHAGDWAEYWAGKDAGGFDKLDRVERPSIFGHADIVVEGAAERLKKLQARKRHGK